MELGLDLIYYTNENLGWGYNWLPLQDDNGRFITNMNDAITYVRSRSAENGIEYIGLSDYGQMKLNNVSWDNL